MKQSDLSFGAPTDATASRNYRRLGLPAKGEERAKIGKSAEIRIRSSRLGQGEDVSFVGGLHRQIADMDSIVASSRRSERLLLVTESALCNEKPQEATPKRNSRSRTVSAA